MSRLPESKDEAPLGGIDSKEEKQAPWTIYEMLHFASIKNKDKNLPNLYVSGTHFCLEGTLLSGGEFPPKLIAKFPWLSAIAKEKHQKGVVSAFVDRSTNLEWLLNSYNGGKDFIVRLLTLFLEEPFQQLNDDEKIVQLAACHRLILGKSSIFRWLRRVNYTHDETPLYKNTDTWNDLLGLLIKEINNVLKKSSAINKSTLFKLYLIVTDLLPGIFTSPESQFWDSLKELKNVNQIKTSFLKIANISWFYQREYPYGYDDYPFPERASGVIQQMEQREQNEAISILNNIFFGGQVPKGQKEEEPHPATGIVDSYLGFT